MDHIKLSKRVFYISLIIGLLLFISGVLGVYVTSKSNELKVFPFLGILFGFILAPCGFLILVYLWKYKEWEKNIKRDVFKAQSFYSIMFKGTWLRWLVTIFVILFLVFFTGGGFEGSLIGGSLYAAITLIKYCLIFFVPLYLIDCYRKLKKQQKYNSSEITPDKPKNEKPQ